MPLPQFDIAIALACYPQAECGGSGRLPPANSASLEQRRQATNLLDACTCQAAQSAPLVDG